MSTKKSQDNATSRWVRAARKSKGLTQKDLAEKLKISKKSLENYESGRVDVPTATVLGIYKICKFAPTFFEPPLEIQSQNIDAELEIQPQNKGAESVKAGEGGGEDVTGKYISLLECNAKRLEQENKELKEKLKKSSKKTKAPKKK